MGPHGAPWDPPGAPWDPLGAPGKPVDTEPDRLWRALHFSPDKSRFRGAPMAPPGAPLALKDVNDSQYPSLGYWDPFRKENDVKIQVMYVNSCTKNNKCPAPQITNVLAYRAYMPPWGTLGTPWRPLGAPGGPLGAPEIRKKCINIYEQMNK